MKKILLLLFTLCLSNLGWGQITQYQDTFGNTYDFGFGQDPEFIELNKKLYFVSDNGNNTGPDFIYSLDQNNTITLEYGLIDGNQYDILALTALNGELYFAMANLSASPSPYRLYRLTGISTTSADLISTSVSLDDAFSGRMIAFKNSLYFSGRLNNTSGNSTAEIGLLSYNSNSGFSQVNTTSAGNDFICTRFTIRGGADDVLYFFDQIAQDPVTFERTYRLYRHDIIAGSSSLTEALGPVDWVGFRAPGLGAFDEFLYIIGEQTTDAEESLYRLSAGTPFTKLSYSGITSNSFVNAVNHNEGAVVYNNQLALFRSSFTTGDIDRILLFPENGTPTEYTIPVGTSAERFFDVLNGALVFSGSNAQSQGIYELREDTNDIISTVRPIEPFSNHSYRPLFGKVFGNNLFFYGNPLGSFNQSLRSLNVYDSKILNAQPTLATQEDVDFFGNLGFERIVGFSFFIQNFTGGGGTSITDLSALNSLTEIPSTILADTQLTDLIGLENLTAIGDFEIFNNPNLVNFCALQPWASNNPGASSDWIVNGNAYNPTFSELQDVSNCSTICTPVRFADSNLRDFLLDPSNSGRILDAGGNPVVLDNGSGEVCSELAATVASLDLSGGYNGNLFSSLIGGDANGPDAFDRPEDVTNGLIAFTNLESLNISNNNFSPRLQIPTVSILTLVANNCVPSTSSVFFGAKLGDSSTTYYLNSVTDFQFRDNWNQVGSISGDIAFDGVPNVITANLSNTNIPGLRIRSNVWDDLRFLTAEDSQLTTLFGLENATDLEVVDVNRANLSGEIDLSVLNQLDTFNADENNISTITISDNNSVQLKRISLRGQGFQNDVFTGIIINGTGSLSQLFSLDISENENLTAIDMSKFPILDTFQMGNTGISFLDFTALAFTPTNFFIYDLNGDGKLARIDVRNNEPNFDISFFELLATGHPNLTCVLVNSADLTTAQNNVTNNTWQFDNTDVVKTSCAPANFVASVDILANGNFSTSLEEGLVDVEILMSIPNANSDNLIVDFDIEVIGNTATADVDFNAVPPNETFTYQYFDDGLAVYTIGISEDDIFESSETFTIRISNPSDNRVTLDGANNGVLEIPITITDDKFVVAKLSATNGQEGSSNVRFITQLEDGNGNLISSEYASNIVFDLTLNAGTALPDVDYFNFQNGVTSITIGPGANIGVTEVTVLNDNIPEPTKNFSATIANPSESRVTIDTATSQATILDNDGSASTPTIQWGTVTSTIEDETVNQPVVLINGEVPTGGLDLSFGLVSGGSAQATPAASPQNELDDFNFVSGGTAPVSYAFGVGEGSYDGSNPVTYQLLTIYDDERYEGNETLRIEIQTTDFNIIGNPVLEYTIIDDDYRVEVNGGNDFSENGGSSNFNITLVDENGNPVSNESGQDIQIEWLDIENAQQGSDYSLSGNGVISDGQQSTTIVINGFDDNLFEGQEFAGIEVQFGQGYYVDINALPRTSIGITDNDNVGVLVTNQIGLEGARDVGFTINLEDENGNIATNSIGNPLGFDIVLASGTGEDGAILEADFTNALKDIAGNTVFIEPGQSSTNFEVVVVDDQKDENRENFLVNVTTTESDIIIENTQLIALIDDNDGQDEDSDNDGISDTTDNCPNTSNTNQADLDNDGIGDVCDPDIDGDGVLNADDAFPENPTESTDTDGDGIGDNGDNCPNNANSDQADANQNGIGDVCETAGNDADNDGINDDVDNCPNSSNADQADLDNDGIGDVCDSDIDGDGIPNDNDDCPEIAGTPENNGCPTEDNPIDQEDIQVLVLSETCPDENNGSFKVTIENKEYTFNVLLDGTSVGTANFDNELEWSGLANGEYQVCLTVDQLPNFEQCFGISIRTFERLSADATAVDPVNLKARFMVGGSTTYEVLVNDKIFTFELPDTKQQQIEVPVEKGKNSIAITGKSDCQGIFIDVIQIGDVSIYPNPLVDMLNFEGLTGQGNAQIMVHTFSGQLIVQASMELNSGMADINLAQLPKGVYLIRVVTLKENIEFKIIKK